MISSSSSSFLGIRGLVWILRIEERKTFLVGFGLEFWIPFVGIKRMMVLGANLSFDSSSSSLYRVVLLFLNSCTSL